MGESQQQEVGGFGRAHGRPCKYVVLGRAVEIAGEEVHRITTDRVPPNRDIGQITVDSIGEEQDGRLIVKFREIALEGMKDTTVCIHPPTGTVATYAEIVL